MSIEASSGDDMPCCAHCNTVLSSPVGRNGQPRRYCCPSHRAAASLARRIERARGCPKPHRRRQPRAWELVDFAALPDEFKVVQPRRVDRALAAGRDVPGVEVKR